MCMMDKNSKKFLSILRHIDFVNAMDVPYTFKKYIILRMEGLDNIIGLAPGGGLSKNL